MTGIPFHAHLSGCSGVDVVWRQLIGWLLHNPGRHGKKVDTRELNL